MGGWVGPVSVRNARRGDELTRAGAALRTLVLWERPGLIMKIARVFKHLARLGGSGYPVLWRCPGITKLRLCPSTKRGWVGVAIPIGGCPGMTKLRECLITLRG